MTRRGRIGRMFWWYWGGARRFVILTFDGVLLRLRHRNRRGIA